MAYTDIDKPTDYFNTVIYTGSGATQSITVGFQPDLVWGKSRSGSGYHHNLVDSVRGNTKYLESDRNNAENTLTDAVTSFTSNGFTLGADAGDREFNENNNSMVAWNWKAGGSASSNSNGSITSSVSANTTAGFSIVSYTGNGSAGATVGHGVGSALDMIIVKKRSSTGQWAVGHKAMDSTFDNFLFLDSTSAKGNADNVFNDTAPTSSVFSIGNAGDTNASGQTYISYCFSEKKGFSKFGSYIGNGNDDGSFIYTGFKPAFVMVKVSSTDGVWELFDNKRTPYNGLGIFLRPHSSASEITDNNYPNPAFLSNGFKWTSLGGGVNDSGKTYIYMCFAESPFTTSTGIPTTAR